MSAGTVRPRKAMWYKRVTQRSGYKKQLPVNKKNNVRSNQLFTMKKKVPGGWSKLLLFYLALLWAGENAFAQPIRINGQPAQLDVRMAGEHSVRITLKPVGVTDAFPYSPTLVQRNYASPAISLVAIEKTIVKRVGNMTVTVDPAPLKVTVVNDKMQDVQVITFLNDGTLTFTLEDQPVLGLGEGGPASPVNSIIPEPYAAWNNQKIEFDRRGRLLKMQPRPQGGAYGSRNPVALLVGTAGWGLFIPTPWGQIDLSQKGKGIFTPVEADGSEGSTTDTPVKPNKSSRGTIPAVARTKGMYDLFVFDAHDPAAFMKDVSLLTGPAVMPPKWALGYMQSFRTLRDETQMIGIVDTFRAKKIPVDAMIYLGTGFIERGWNKPQPSFEFNPALFHRKPDEMIRDMHQRNVKVVLHIWPWDEDKLPGLHGTIPPRPGDTMNGSHILQYWKQHRDLVKAGVDGFWPDAGDRFNLFERLKRHEMYYYGPLSERPQTRPWSLHRNGYLGIARWGGWVWSGDIISSWKTLEAQVAVGINHSLSLSPYWGSDIGGFFPNSELTGELYARWFQFGAFCPSFRSHGKTWSTRLPWGWGLGSRGVLEGNKGNEPLESELNNPAIEPVCKTYDELRYQLLPYNYTLAWEARQLGMPFMRAMWLHYPEDVHARSMGSQYLWGRDMLIAPVFEKGATTRQVYLPEGNWYDWWTNKKEKGGRTVTREIDLSIMPLYIREGAIIPLDPVRQYTTEPVLQPTTLRIYAGADGQFTLYDDDGSSLDYLHGKASITKISWSEAKQQLSLEPSEAAKTIDRKQERKFQIQLLPKGTTKTIIYTGKKISIDLNR